MTITNLTVKTALFDLDGTITDSAGLIQESVAYTATEMGISVPNQEVLRSFVGPKLTTSFRKHFNLSGANNERAVQIYRSYYTPRMTQVRVFDGMIEVLEKLKKTGWKLGIASAKYEPLVVEISTALGLNNYFDLVAGSLEIPGSENIPDADCSPRWRRRKPGVIAYAIEELAADRTQTWMIGDRKDDYQGALLNQIPAIGVAWGAGTAQEFPDCPWVTTPAELVQVLGVE